jgi:hypothetical protein
MADFGLESEEAERVNFEKVKEYRKLQAAPNSRLERWLDNRHLYQLEQSAQEGMFAAIDPGTGRTPRTRRR